MRLIAKNSDYYDHYARNRALSDQLYLWDRTSVVEKIDFALSAMVHVRSAWNASDIFTAVGFCVWFCGQVIPVVRVRRMSGPDRFYYSFKDIPADVLGKKPEKGRSLFGRSHWEQFQKLFSLADKNGWGKTWDMEQYPSRVVLPKKSIEDMHRILGTPVFCHPHVIDKDGRHAGYGHSELHNRMVYNAASPCVLVNPILDAIDFSNRIDSFEAFQCLERYLSNELAPRDGRMDKPIPDKIKAESKGFDKFSFRKEATKGKKA